MSAFFPSNSHLMVYFIICEMSEFPINFPQHKNMQKKHIWGEPGEPWGTLGNPGRAVGSHTFPIVFVVFSYLIPILWYTSSLGKQMSFPSISHNIEKCSEMHQIGRPAKLVPILSPKYKYFFSIRFPSQACITTWEICSFSHQFPIVSRKCSKINPVSYQVFSTV